MNELKEKLECCKGNALSGLAGVATLLLLALAVSTVIDIFDKMGKSENYISVSGSGEIYAKPDLAMTSFSVLTEKKTVAEALSENTKNMNAVIQAVKDQGVEEKDLKTTNFYISPRYEYEKVEESGYYPPEGRRTLVGYQITQTLEVKIRDLDKTASILEAGVDAGSNQVGDLQFTIEDEDELVKQAREEAINEAKEKAELLASQLGVRLVGVSSFSESSNRTNSYYGMGGTEESSAPKMSYEDISIETGENKVSVSAYITYKIK
jgi:hypothetical protein